MFLLAIYFHQEVQGIWRLLELTTYQLFFCSSSFLPHFEFRSNNMNHQWDLLFKSSQITLEEKSWIALQESKGKSTTRTSASKQPVGLRSSCHSIHSALPGLPHTEIKGCGSSFTLYPDSKAVRWTKKPTLPSAGQPLTGRPSSAVHWGGIPLGQGSQEPAQHHGAPRKLRESQLCWKSTTSNNYRNKLCLVSWKASYKNTLEKEIRAHTPISSMFFNRPTWAILRWRYESWMRKGNKESLSSEKWWRISKM